MDLITTIKLSLNGILGNKLRSFLTMLGIIIGVSAVIILVSIGKGTTADITSSLEEVGSNKISVTITGQDSVKTLSYNDLAVFKELEGVSTVSPTVSGSITAKYDTTTYDTTLIGVDEYYKDANSYELQQGRTITPLDVDNRNKVVVLGSDTATELFSLSNPVDQMISINGTDFKIIGVLKEKGSSSAGSNDDMMLTPFSTGQRFLSISAISSFTIMTKNSEDVERVMAKTELELLSIFKSEDAYTVNNSQDLLSTITDITNTMSIALGGIAGISLLVGGIGIMNIMLVSVTERTREIGIRKAIGAKKRDILLQFLIESAVIGSLGGIIGIVFGYAVCEVLGSFNINTVISLPIVLFAFVFSLAMGIIFGIMPANKAAKLRPVDALRYE